MIDYNRGGAASLAAFAFVCLIGIGDASAHGMGGGGGGGGGGVSVPAYRPPVVQLPVDPGMLGDLNPQNMGNPGPQYPPPDASPSPPPNVIVNRSYGIRTTTVYDSDASGRHVKTVTKRDSSTGMVVSREVIILDDQGFEVSRTSTNYGTAKGAPATVQQSVDEGNTTRNNSTTVKDPSARGLRQQTLQQLGIGK